MPFSLAWLTPAETASLTTALDDIIALMDQPPNEGERAALARSLLNAHQVGQEEFLRLVEQLKGRSPETTT